MYCTLRERSADVTPAPPPEFALDNDLLLLGAGLVRPPLEAHPRLLQAWRKGHMAANPGDLTLDCSAYSGCIPSQGHQETTGWEWEGQC